MFHLFLRIFPFSPLEKALMLETCTALFCIASKFIILHFSCLDCVIIPALVLEAAPMIAKHLTKGCMIKVCVTYLISSFLFSQ